MVPVLSFPYNRFLRRCAPIMGLASAMVGCRDEAPTLPAIEVAILAISPEGQVHDLDMVHLVGDADAPDLGPLPEDSLVWMDNSEVIGRGRAASVRARAGMHQYRLVASFGIRTGSDSRVVEVDSSGLGRLLWSVDLGPRSDGGLSLSVDGVLYARMGADGKGAAAISLDGVELWRRDLPGNGSWTPPALTPDNSPVYSFSGWTGPEPGPSGGGGVFALNPDGSLRWVFGVEEHAPAGIANYHVHGGAAVDGGGRIYVAAEESGRGTHYGISPVGQFVWRTEGGVGRFWSHTTLPGDSLVLTLADAPGPRDSTPLVMAASGVLRRLVQTPVLQACGATAALDADGGFYVAGDFHFFYALRSFAPDGSLRWTRLLPHRLRTGSPILAFDRILLSAPNGGVLVLTKGGDSITTFGPAPDGYRDNLTLGANGVAYVQANDTLFSYGADGARRFAIPIPHVVSGQCHEIQAGPVIAPDGTVIIRASEFGVMAFRDTVGPAIDAPWPTFQGSFRRAGRRATDY